MFALFRPAYPALSVLLRLTLSECNQPQRPIQNSIPEVGNVTLVGTNVALTTELPGRTSSFRTAEVRPHVGGILQKRLFDEGTVVEAWQTLYQLDTPPYRATLAKAEVSLESSRLLSRCYERLLKTRAITQQDQDDARSSWLQAQADIDTARIDLGYTKITAPISDRIGRSSVTQGALLTDNQTDAPSTIQQLDPIYVDIPQSSTALLKLQDEFATGRLKKNGEQQANECSVHHDCFYFIRCPKKSRILTDISTKTPSSVIYYVFMGVLRTIVLTERDSQRVLPPLSALDFTFDITLGNKEVCNAA